jgi:ketopantoate reductase
MKDSRFKFRQPMIHPMVGAVGRIGRRVKVPTPMCDFLYAILLPYNNGPPGES